MIKQNLKTGEKRLTITGIPHDDDEGIIISLHWLKESGIKRVHIHNGGLVDYDDRVILDTSRKI